jgi:type I restriction enzyme S subunit
MNQMTPNNIPQGYKATALGIIPQEWEVKRIKDFGPVITGSTPSTLDSENYGGRYMFVSPADLSEDAKYIMTTEKTLSDKGYSQARRIPKGSILFTCIGSTIGKIGIASQDLATNQQINSIVTNGEYLFYALSFQSNRIKILANEQAVPIINKSDFERIKVAFPPLAEQRKIAEVLGVWDEAIEKQARLIEKLALRKRALMQRLLSAKLRLPGFSEPWKEQKINKITTIKKGEQVNKDVLFSNAKYPVINGGITPSGYLDTYNTKANTITISEGGNSCGYVNFMTTPFWSGGHCYTIDAKDGINNLFIYQLLKNNEKYIMSLRVGSGLPNIQIKDLGNIKFMIPTYQEQTAIAEVLTAADREIELAKEKLERLRRQKRGLMQQLLTGKKRVKY